MDIEHVSAGGLGGSHPRTDLTFTTANQSVAIPAWATLAWVCYEADTFYVGLATTASNGMEMPSGGYFFPLGVGATRSLHYKAKTTGGSGSVCFLP